MKMNRSKQLSSDMFYTVAVDRCARLLLCCLLAFFSARTKAATVRVSEKEIASSTSVVVPVSFETEADAAAYQMDLIYDPDSYTISAAAKGVGGDQVEVVSNVVQEGLARVVVSSYPNLALPEGVAFRVPLIVRHRNKGAYPVALANFRVVNASGALLDGKVGLSLRIQHLTENATIRGTDGVEFELELSGVPGDVARVQYYVDGVEIGESTGGPFSLRWLPAGLGTFNVRVVAFDAKGNEVVSREYPVIVAQPITSKYTGLLQANPKTPGTTGTIYLATALNGTFTVKVVLGGVALSGIGKFAAGGTAAVALARTGQTPLRLELVKNATGVNDNVTGLITDGTIANGVPVNATFVCEIRADRYIYDGKLRKAPEAGYYTFAINADTDAVAGGAPAGTGYGSVKVKPTGQLTFLGTAGDGTKLSGGTFVSKAGEAGLYASLYSKRGSAAGTVGFREIMNTSDFDGTLAWFRPGLPPDSSTSEFSEEVEIAGARYVAPRSGRVIPLANAVANAAFFASDGGLVDPIDRLLTVNSKNVVAVPFATPEKLAMAITPTTGLFRGTFVHPITRKVTKFGGAIVQKQEIGAGTFLSEANSGAVTFSENPANPAGDEDGSLGTLPLPVIAFKTPAANARILSPATVGFTGAAKDKQGISEVRYQVVHGSDVSEILTATGTTAWTAPLQLDPDAGGNYTVYVKAIDGGGNESELLARSFFYVVKKDLQVSVSGAGSVSAGYLGTTVREVGRNYTITAKPAAGKKFNGWTGSVVSASPTITFTMAEEFSLQASFQ